MRTLTYGSNQSDLVLARGTANSRAGGTAPVGPAMAGPTFRPPPIFLGRSKGSSQKFSVVPETNIVHFVLGPPPLPLKRTQLAMLDDENRIHVHVICTVCRSTCDFGLHPLPPPPPPMNHVRFRDDKKLLRRPLMSCCDHRLYIRTRICDLTLILPCTRAGLRASCGLWVCGSSRAT